MKTITRIITAVSRFMYVIAGVALACSMFLTVADTVLRCFRRPIVGTYELVGLLGAVVIGFSIPQTSRLKGHVVMDFLTGKLSKTAQAVFQIITRLLAVVLFAVLGWNLWMLGSDFVKTGEVTLTLQLPLYPVAYGIAVCCFFQCLVLLLECFERRERSE